MFDKDITILNKCFNTETKENEYKLAYVKGFWSSNDGITISNNLLVKSEGLIVRILMSEDGYVSPSEYTGADKTWTLQNGDYLIKGKVDSVTTIADLKDNYECMQITDVAVKDYGSSDMQHYAITGK